MRRSNSAIVQAPSSWWREERIACAKIVPAASAKQETDAYIREAAGRSPAQEIADAKALLEAGTISQAEFDSLKAKALA